MSTHSSQDMDPVHPSALMAEREATTRRDVEPKVLERAWARERARRLQAEQLLSEKSRELYTSYTELQHAHADLQQKQQILVQAEKMASLGVLAAGVAHEINNPIGFVLSNLHTFESNLPRLLHSFSQLRDLVRQIDDSGPLAQRRADVLQVLAVNDVDYVLADAADLVAESLTGLERVRSIVAGLRTFARSESDVFEPTDIHVVIESALTLLHNQLKHVCDVERDFAQVPQVLANPGKLAQVLVNLLANAMQAIEEKATGNGLCGSDKKGAWGTVTIATASDERGVFIKVSDSGCGIAENVRQRLFQPFFTTKPVGQGTGLGLAISYGIVREHCGEIDVESELGSGATFIVRLPLPTAC